jgi:hypothetical protein
VPDRRQYRKTQITGHITERPINLSRPFNIIDRTIDCSSLPTDANIDATYNRTPFKPKTRFSMDKPKPTLYS